MSRLRMAVVGVGHLGKEHARILASFPDVELVGVVDVNSDQAQAVARQWQTRAYTAAWPLLNLVDAAVIAAPTCHHHAEARPFLERSIPLLIEKPLAASSAEAEELSRLAEQHGAFVQVGHIERFNPAFEELQQRPMQAKFVECERLGRFTGRSLDIGAVLDLMIHDIDLLLTLTQSSVTEVHAVGATVFGGHEDLVNARLAFANGCVANLTASRLSPKPVRRMRVWAPEGYARLDFARRRLSLVQPSAELRQGALDPRSLPPALRTSIQNDLFGTHLQVLDLDCDHGDQLTRELRDFVQSVQSGRAPRVTGQDGCNAVAVAGRILDKVRGHLWEGKSDGPQGPAQMPMPLGWLFQSGEGRGAAA
ncbi:MAG: Gfo/Idh/MocA family oxidoreductase [Planctomycetia bacterium]|nr:Gfo/Idh/MocA family oxidoreductase [Planctomycetia bacterium]